jgi:hypothetical protein
MKKIVLLVLIEISQAFKTFWVNFKALLSKKYYFLKNSFEKIEYQNTILYLSKPRQVYLHRKYLQMVYIK